jgi:hypothetical protein
LIQGEVGEEGTVLTHQVRVGDKGGEGLVEPVGDPEKVRVFISGGGGGGGPVLGADLEEGVGEVVRDEGGDLGGVGAKGHDFTDGSGGDRVVRHPVDLGDEKDRHPCPTVDDDGDPTKRGRVTRLGDQDTIAVDRLPVFVRDLGG